MTHCGSCANDAASWGSPRPTHTGLRLCNFSTDDCHTRVHVALDAARCPVPRPRVRMGLDAGTQPGWADVARDGVARRRWAPSACDDASGGAADAGGACATLRAAAGVPTNLTLWFRVLSGGAVLQPQQQAGGLRVRRLEPRAVPSAWLAVRLADGAPSTLLLSGAVSSAGTASAAAVAASAAAGASDVTAVASPPPPSLEPDAASLTWRHVCAAEDAGGIYAVSARLLVPEHVPLEIGWRVRCE